MILLGIQMLRQTRIQLSSHALVLCSGWLWVILCLLPAAPAWPQELSLLGGYMQHAQPPEDSYTWLLDYSQGMGEHAALSFASDGRAKNIQGHRRLCPGDPVREAARP